MHLLLLAIQGCLNAMIRQTLIIPKSTKRPRESDTDTGVCYDNIPFVKSSYACYIHIQLLGTRFCYCHSRFVVESFTENELNIFFVCLYIHYE